VRYQLKTLWRNGTTHAELEPAEFIAKLAALVLPLRAYLTRFHGVFAPNAKLRAQLTPSGRGKRRPADEASTGASSDHSSPDEKRRSMTWAQRLKRVFNIDVSTCSHCGGALRIVASIEEPTAIRAILAHFEKYGTVEKERDRLAPRAPPALAARPCDAEMRLANVRSSPRKALARLPPARQAVRNRRLNFLNFRRRPQDRHHQRCRGPWRH